MEYTTTKLKSIVQQDAVFPVNRQWLQDTPVLLHSEQAPGGVRYTAIVDYPLTGMDFLHTLNHAAPVSAQSIRVVTGDWILPDQHDPESLGLKKLHAILPMKDFEPHRRLFMNSLEIYQEKYVNTELAEQKRAFWDYIFYPSNEPLPFLSAHGFAINSLIDASLYHNAPAHNRLLSGGYVPTKWGGKPIGNPELSPELTHKLTEASDWYMENIWLAERGIHEESRQKKNVFDWIQQRTGENILKFLQHISLSRQLERELLEIALYKCSGGNKYLEEKNYAQQRPTIIFEDELPIDQAERNITKDRSMRIKAADKVLEGVPVEDRLYHYSFRRLYSPSVIYPTLAWHERASGEITLLGSEVQSDVYQKVKTHLDSHNAQQMLGQPSFTPDTLAGKLFFAGLSRQLKKQIPESLVIRDRTQDIGPAQVVLIPFFENNLTFPHWSFSQAFAEATVEFRENVRKLV